MPDRGAASPDTPSREGPAPVVILGALVLLALGLRFLRLGDWSFEATEMFTLRDSVTPQWGNARPLGYLLNYYLVRPFLPLDEFGLRLVPAIAGVLTIPALYRVSRRLLGTRVALWSALLLTLSPLHLFYSQLARYWALVFLFSAVFPYLLYLGVRDRKASDIVLGCVALILAILAHPVSAVLLGGPILWLMATYFRPHYFRQAWTYRAFRWGVLASVVLGAVLAWRLLPLLWEWVTLHDRNPGTMTQFLRAPSPGHGAKQIVFLAAFAESLTLPVALAAAVGVYVVWRRLDRTLGVFLTSLAVFHVLFITLLSIRTPVSQYYLVPAVPVFYLGAGVFLDRVFATDWGLRPRWVVPAAIALMVLTAGFPTLASEYRNGRRFDFRGAARWMEPQLSPGDAIFSDQPMVLAHYLSSDRKVERLRQDPEPLAETMRRLEQAEGEASLWVVAPAPAHAFRTDLKAGGLAAWLYGNCRLSQTIGRGRLDFRQQYLQVFRCPTTPSARPEASS